MDILIGVLIGAGLLIVLYFLFYGMHPKGHWLRRPIGEFLKLEPLPKLTKLRHDVTVNISIIDDFENRIDMEKIYEAVEHMRKEIMVAYGMTDVEITGKSTTPWLL